MHTVFAQCLVFRWKNINTCYFRFIILNLCFIVWDKSFLYKQRGNVLPLHSPIIYLLLHLLYTFSDLNSCGSILIFIGISGYNFIWLNAVHHFIDLEWISRNCNRMEVRKAAVSNPRVLHAPLLSMISEYALFTVNKCSGSLFNLIW